MNLLPAETLTAVNKFLHAQSVCSVLIFDIF